MLAAASPSAYDSYKVRHREPDFHFMQLHQCRDCILPCPAVFPGVVCFMLGRQGSCTVCTQVNWCLFQRRGDTMPPPLPCRKRKTTGDVATPAPLPLPRHKREMTRQSGNTLAPPQLPRSRHEGVFMYLTCCTVVI